MSPDGAISPASLPHLESLEAFYQRALQRRGSPLAFFIGVFPVPNDGGKG